MDWIKIFPEDLEAVLNKPQLETLKAQSLRSKNRNITEEIIANIIVRIRAEIAASGINLLDTDHSRIPPELKDCALYLAIEALQTRISSLEVSNSQTKHFDLARQTLLRVASGELPVSRPRYAIRTASKKSLYANKKSPTQITRNSLRLL